MKKSVVFCLTLLMIILGISSVHAQGDVVTVQPQHSTNNPCGFILTIANHNSALKSIDEIKLEITNGNGANFTDFQPLPAHWTLANQTNLVVDATSDNGGIAPGATLGGFVFAYDIQYDSPVTITWTTRSVGNDVSTGTIEPICTEYQGYNRLDTVTYNTSQSGCDPCFSFTLVNKNQEGTQAPFNVRPIWHIAFQLENLNGGTLRPSKITPAQDWVLDSVTTYTAYFHTDNSPLSQTNNAAGEFKICLRGNPLTTKYNFVWFAFDDQDALIDRDTIFNISNTASCSTTEADSLTVKGVTGCLYNVTLKNYHVSNLLPPSRIVKLVLTSKTTGVTFSAAPSAPPNWNKPVVTASSIVYTAPTDSDGIAGGIISTNQFSFSVAGQTTSNFDIGWETDRAGKPYPSTVSTLTTGTVTQKCTVATPAIDTVIILPGVGECNFDLRVKNSHNIKPQSNLSQVTITIPAGSGQITPTSNTLGWNSTAVSATQIKFQAPTSTDALVSDNSADFNFIFAPKTPGANVTATWATFDDQAVGAGAPIYSGDVTIKCTPTITICDTVTRTASLSNDSCTKTLTIHNRKTTDILSLVLTVTNGWKIDTASTPPSGWTKQVDGSRTFVTYTSTSGLKADQSQDFNLKFSGYFPQPVDTFTVVAVTTDRNSVVCTSIDSEISCISHLLKNYVQPHSDNIGVVNFTIKPNPTRGSADISFDMNTPERVIVTVLDVLGHEVSTLSSKLMPQGTYHIPYVMNGLPNGTYYIRMQTPLGVMTRKLVLTK